METFDELVTGAEAADISGWGSGRLDGRATEERPPWGYARQLSGRLAVAHAALDIDTGGGEILAEATTLPPSLHATESWPPNAEQARRRLGGRGVRIVATAPGKRPTPKPPG